MLQRVSYFRSTWCHFPLVLFVIGQCPLRQTDPIVPFFNRHPNPRTEETNQPATKAIPACILSPAVYHPRWAFRCCYFICIHPRCNFLPSVHCRWGQYRHIHVIIVSPNFHAHRRFTAPSFHIWDFITSFFQSTFYSISFTLPTLLQVPTHFIAYTAWHCTPTPQ